MASVQRYTKTFALTKYRSQVPDVTMERGMKFAKNIRASLSFALASKKAAKHLWSAPLRNALDRARFGDTAFPSDYGGPPAGDLSADEGWTTE